MDNYNEFIICYCKYCNKEHKSKNSLLQHEARCKNNPNRLIPKNFGWKKGKTRVSPTKGKIWITNGILNKVVFESEFKNTYAKDGWYRGVNDEFKNKISLKTTGRASTFEKEEERKKKISNTMKKKHFGGYVRGSGRGKKGWYKGVFCDSSWELAFLYYYLENNLYIKRCTEKRKYVYNGEERVYIPDFVTNDGVVEIKGYETEQSIEKKLQNPDIKILYYNDMKFYIDFVTNRFGKKFYEKLYE